MKMKLLARASMTLGTIATAGTLLAGAAFAHDYSYDCSDYKNCDYKDDCYNECNKDYDFSKYHDECYKDYSYDKDHCYKDCNDTYTYKVQKYEVRPGNGYGDKNHYHLKSVNYNYRW